MKTVIAGGRSFNDYNLMSYELDYGLDWTITEIVSGTARGADTLGEIYAKSKDISVKRMPADWNQYGRSAGYRRNEDMAKYADACVCFWDGKSRGTEHMINLANKYKRHLKIIKY